MNLNVRFHLVVPDGVFVEDGAGLRFEMLPVPTNAGARRPLDRRRVARRASSARTPRRARAAPCARGSDATARERQAGRAGRAFVQATHERARPQWKFRARSLNARSRSSDSPRPPPDDGYAVSPHREPRTIHHAAGSAMLTLAVQRASVRA